MPLFELLLQVSHRFAHGRDVLSHIRFTDSSPFEMLQPQTLLVEFPLKLRERHFQSRLLQPSNLLSRFDSLAKSRTVRERSGESDVDSLSFIVIDECSRRDATW